MEGVVEMIETKIVEVKETEYERVIREYQCFGWSVTSTQKIDYINSYRTGGGNARRGYFYTIHNDRTAYYSITFQRDTNIKNYSEINMLWDDYLAKEREINALQEKYNEYDKQHRNKGILLAVLIIVLPFSVLLVLPAFIIKAIISKKRIPNVSETEKIEKEMENARQTLSELLSRANALVSEVTCNNKTAENE